MFLLAKLLVIVFLGAILLVPAAILALIFLAEIVGRLVIKLFGYTTPASPFFGPFLDSEIRRSFQDPKIIIARSGIEPGMRVLEVGCGSGAYTTVVARWIGEKGTEYALDIQPAMLEQLEVKLSKEGNRAIRNVTLVESNVEHMPFKNDYFDLVFMVSVLQQIPNRSEALREINRVLKPGGTFAVTEILMDPYYSFRKTTKNLGLAAGFLHEATLGNAWHYTVRFKKAAPIEAASAQK